jgi:hypothetical protein
VLGVVTGPCIITDAYVGLRWFTLVYVGCRRGESTLRLQGHFRSAAFLDLLSDLQPKIFRLVKELKEIKIEAVEISSVISGFVEAHTIHTPIHAPV